MKKVLFIGVTEYDLRERDSHLRKKFEDLSRGIDILVMARGKPMHKKMWNADFYLIAHRRMFLPFSLFVGSYLCFSKGITTIVCQGPLIEGIVGSFLAFIFRKELIVEIHGDWEEGPFLNKKRVFAPLLKSIVPLTGRFVLKRADKIRTLTDIIKEETKKSFPDKKYFVFPTFTDIDMFLEEKNTSFKKYIATVAVLSPIKNIETLIEAFLIVQKKFSDFKLVIVGEGPSLEKHKVQITNYKLEGKIILTGRLSSREVKDVLKDCYMFVLPSLSEGFGRVFIEAMALSKPVIGSNVGGVPEIIKDGSNGFLVDPKDMDGLAKRIEELFNSPQLADEMGKRGRKFVENNFSNEIYINNYIEMING